MFSFLITGILVVPFIDFLYKIKFTRRVEAPKIGKVPLFDKLHDKKAGTPVGGGVLIIAVVCLLFAFTFPVSRYLGVFIQTAYSLRVELFVIFFTFISFGLLGLLDDYKKMLGKPTRGVLGLAFGLSRRIKFILQWTLALIISLIIYFSLGIQILHIPILGITLHLGLWYIPFSAFVIVSFTNAFNITDGLDGLASGLLMICLIVFGVIAANNIDTPLSLFIALWIGALIAFLYFNIYPARIYLGDAGALAFGATLAVVGLLTGKIVALAVISGVYVIIAGSSALQIFFKRVFKKKLFKVAPIHMYLRLLGWEEPKIVMRLWLAQALFAIFGLWITLAFL